MPKTTNVTNSAQNMPLWLKITFGIVIVLVLACIIFFVWTVVGHKSPDQTALNALNSTSEVKIDTQSNGTLVFTPLNNFNGQGIIFYSGALVEPAAYAPLLQLFAEDGYLVIAPKFTFDLSITNSNIAQQFILKNSEVTNWTGVGHSLGGKSLSDFAATHPTSFAQIILLGSYPEDPEFVNYPGKVASVIGTEDDIINKEKLQTIRQYLPKSAALVTIPGANHAQYGNYGPQKNDGQATISPEEQQAATLETLQILTGNYQVSDPQDTNSLPSDPETILPFVSGRVVPQGTQEVQGIQGTP